jgi:bifunctional UDP-N-acetylglucosamine pyrophosphorylase/glucosamine-1-phosphate N-acetyltransferase
MQVQQDAGRIPDQAVVVILAAGKGTRMGRDDKAKVCFEIDSVPAINRQIDTFKRQGFHRFLLVVGNLAQQVLAAVAQAHEGVLSVYQHPQLGTGHAARIAAQALQSMGFQGHVVVTAGDSFLEPQVIEALVNGYVRQQSDMAILVVRKQRTTGGSLGRVLVDRNGQALDIIESNDLSRQAVVDSLKDKLACGAAVTGREILALAQQHIPKASKREKALGGLLALVGDAGAVDQDALSCLVHSDRYNLQIDGRRYSAEEIENLAAGVNLSLYLFRADVFYQGVGLIDNNNAQGEYYLTDVVRILSGMRTAQGARARRVRAVSIDNPNWIQAFNSPDELAAIQEYVRRKRPAA